MKTNYGLDLKRECEEQSDKDWEYLGAVSVPCIAEMPEATRSQYLPAGEVQRGLDDFMDCASRSVLNILETKFNYLIKTIKLSLDNQKWLINNGYVSDKGVTFSDRFVAINSGTTRQGNSLKSPLEAVRKQGLIPKRLLPANTKMTWSDYHNQKDITAAMRELGAEFARRFTINYERVYEDQYGDLIKQDMLDVAGYAWPKPKNGVYPKVQYGANHAFMIYANAFYAFDNYIDEDGDFIKQLARDYNFLDYGYRVYIAREQTPSCSTFMSRLRSFLLSYAV